MEHRYSFKQFLPLISILSVIIIATIIKQSVHPTWTASLFMQDFMGIFFIVFASFKIVNLPGFAEAYATYDLLAERSTAYAYAYPFIELTLGILYITGSSLLFAHWATLVIMLISSAGVVRSLAKKDPMMCACLGTVFTIPMTYVTLGEDIVMAIMAAYMITTTV